MPEDSFLRKIRLAAAAEEGRERLADGVEARYIRDGESTTCAKGREEL